MQQQKIKGITTELLVAAYMSNLGIQVSVPFGDCARYDQIWDVNGKLFRVQVKHATIRPGGIVVHTKSTVRKAKEAISRPYTKDEIDAIATFYNDRCYIVPVHLLPNNEFFMRNVIPKNCQKTDIHWLEDFEVERWLKIIGQPSPSESGRA